MISPSERGKKGGIFNNEAVGAKIGVLYFPMIDAPSCTWAGRVSVGLCEKGIQHAANSSSEYQLEYVVAAENKQAVSLKHTSHYFANTLLSTIMSKSLVVSVARLDCPLCFSQVLKTSQFCSENIGLLMLTTTIWTGNYSLLNDPLNETDIVTNYSSTTSFARIQDTTFRNFRTSYSALAGCSG